jgi:hypothetical protein
VHVIQKSASWWSETSKLDFQTTSLQLLQQGLQE